ncbi:unnamed protein product, partial [Lampetra fluviatilis]
MPRSFLVKTHASVNRRPNYGLLSARSVVISPFFSDHAFIARPKVLSAHAPTGGVTLEAAVGVTPRVTWPRGSTPSSLHHQASPHLQEPPPASPPPPPPLLPPPPPPPSSSSSSSSSSSTMARKAFTCKFCAKEYVSLGALKMHIRTHTLPCVCKICGKAFSRPWLLQGHVRTHTGEKPFSCPHCSRAFADRSNLRAHLQTHSEVKKYHCARCAKTFSRMSLLNKHEEGTC